MTPLALSSAFWHYEPIDIVLCGIAALGLVVCAGLLIYVLTRNRNELP